MEDYRKPHLTYRKQLELLENRGLIIADKTAAEKFLSKINYYRFSAYCVPFEDYRHSFKSNITFEHIQQLYTFDRHLRFLIDEALEVIEISIRSTAAFYLSEKYGPFFHENSANFYISRQHSRWLDTIHEEANRSKEVYIEHYKTKYNDFPKLPIWIAVEIMSFGSLSKLFSNLIKNNQIFISQKFGMHHKVLISWLHTFSYIRNICAHHCRLWNRKLSISMIVPKSSNWKYIKANRISSVIFAINSFLPKLPQNIDMSNDWHIRMGDLLSHPIDIQNFHELMGLPENYKEKYIWRNNYDQ